MYKKYTRFSSAAYQNCDPIAKELIVRHLNSIGLFALAEEKQEADVKALRPVYYEGEIKPGWIGEWPASFDTVDIPYRKKNLFKKHHNAELYFWVISGDLKQAWEVPAGELTEDRVHKKKTTRTKPEGEEESFYRIPLKNCRLIQLAPEKGDHGVEVS